MAKKKQSRSARSSRSLKSIKTLLIANRGEIARRIIKSCRERGIKTVVPYVADEKNAAFVEEADLAVPFPSRGKSESLGAAAYLSIPEILTIAKKARVDALHPGYGFLSESASFSDAAHKAGILFIGPSAKAMGLLGNKIEAKKLAQSLGVPRAPSMFWEGGALEEVGTWGSKVGLPLIIKSAAGGGGRGMREVRQLDELAGLLERASDEARRLFGSGAVYLEKKIYPARHIEVQIAGDHAGNVITILDRDCSYQRNHQKVIEEAPAPRLSNRLRESMHEAAIALAKEAGYSQLGTVEFLIDRTGHFYFLEVNCRLQVEHPVTEMVTRLDLVGLQLDIAEGKLLPELIPVPPISQGYSIEARLCAENPAEGFRPSVGKIEQLSWPESQSLRVDSGFRPGDTLTTHFDSLLAKFIIHENTREEARKSLVAALRDAAISGVDTNQEYLISLLEAPQFAALEHHTGSATEPQFLKQGGAMPIPPGSGAKVSCGAFDPWESGDNFGRRGSAPAAALSSTQSKLSAQVTAGRTKIFSPLPGKVLQISASKGARFKEGDTLLILESMKMEHPLRAAHSGKVLSTHCRAGQQVEAKSLLLEVNYE